MYVNDLIDLAMSFFEDDQILGIRVTNFSLKDTHYSFS